MDEVVRDLLVAEELDDARAGPAADGAGRQHRPAERAQSARDVDALAACDGSLLDGAMAPAETEVRNGEGSVDRGVEGDGDNHVNQPPM